MAEQVAAQVRAQILSGALVDGDRLPSREQLLEEFQVSQPSLREALRILETEGLIVVRRGKRGGSIVRRPTDANAAYTLAMILQSRQVTLSDTGTALQLLEPICASLCASRKDRRRTVVPQLVKANAAVRESINDLMLFTERCRSFHETIVESCGNETLILIVGSLEALYSTHIRLWAKRVNASGRWPDDDYGKRSVAEHEMLIEFIRDGNGEEAAKLVASHHLESLALYLSEFDQTTMIDSELVRA